MEIRLTGAAAMAGLALAVAGCSGSTPSQPALSSSTAVPSLAASAPPAASAGGCLLGANGADVQVGVANPVQSCNQWVQDLAGSGLAWNPITALAVPGSQAADGDTYWATCDLTANGGEELYVEDAGSMTYGDSICSDEEQNGWAPESQPGPLASAAQQGEEQQAVASASASSASASAAQASQESASDARLQADVSQLDKDYATWSSDVSTAKSALQAVQAEPRCSGGTSDQQTYDDAQNVYDDGQAIYDDESALSTDISQIQGDAGPLAGVAAYARDVSVAQAALSKGQGAVNEDESSKVQQAATAVQTATGSCT
jgi:hypothetical protein